MYTFQDLTGGLHNSCLCPAVTTQYFKHRALVYFDKDSWFIESDSYTPVNPPGTTMHIDEREMKA
jgi:hypothetical protein